MRASSCQVYVIKDSKERKILDEISKDERAARRARQLDPQKISATSRGGQSQFDITIEAVA